MAHYQTGICQNCSTTLSRELLLAGKNFCGEKCTQTASLVRYCRNKIKEGTFHNPDIQEAIKYKLGFVLSGGYHKNARRVSPAMRSFIFARDNHMCVLCGDPATDIDHISGDDNTPENLRALCRRCNMDRVKFHEASPEQKEEARAIMRRVHAEEPTRLCDNEVLWDKVWREIASANKALGRR